MRKFFISAFAVIFSMFLAFSAHAEKAIAYGGNASATLKCGEGSATFGMAKLKWEKGGRGNCPGYVTVAGWEKAAKAALSGQKDGRIKFFLNTSNLADGKKFDEYYIVWRAKQTSGTVYVHVNGWYKNKVQHHQTTTVVKKTPRVKTRTAEPNVVTLDDFPDAPVARVKRAPAQQDGCVIRLKCKLILDVTAVEVNFH